MSSRPPHAPSREETLQCLIRDCQQYDRRAQTAFYEFFKRRLYGICCRYAGNTFEADDILQEAFVLIFKQIHQLRDTAAIHGWVKAVVIRTAINYYNRQMKPQKRFTSLDDTGSVAIEDDHYAKIIDSLQTEVLLALINQLPDGYRMILNLHLVDGYTHREIADILGISEGTSRSQFSRGKMVLLKKMQATGLLSDAYSRHSIS